MTNHQAELSADKIEQLSTGVYIMALRALGDSRVAEEVSQETLVRTLQALRDGRPRDPAALGAFVRAIARHVITDSIRESTRERRFSSAARAATGDPTADHPLDALVAEEERARVRSALITLPQGDRELLRLCYFNGLRPQEVAARLGEPAARIRTRKSRALARLRRAILGTAERTCNESRLDPTE